MLLFLMLGPIPAIVAALLWIVRFFRLLWPFIRLFWGWCVLLLRRLSTLRGLIWSLIVYAVATWLGWLDDFNDWVYQEGVKQVEDIWNQIFNEETGHFWTLFDWFFDVGIELVETFFPNISDYVAPYLATIDFAMVWVGRLNDFFPLTEAGVLLGVFWAFILVFLSIKFILKIIPGIG